jgi:hypothetical protein
VSSAATNGKPSTTPRVGRLSFAGDRGVITLGVTLGRTGHAPIPIQVHRRPFSHLVMGPALAMGVAGLAVGWAEVHPASTGTLMLATFFADTTRHVRGVGAVLEVAFKGRREGGCSNRYTPAYCGCSSMVEHVPSMRSGFDPRPPRQGSQHNVHALFTVRPSAISSPAS